MANSQNDNNLKYHFEHVEDLAELIHDVITQKLCLVENPIDIQIK